MQTKKIASSKRILAALLSICLLVGMFPLGILTAAAEEMPADLTTPIRYEIEELYASDKYEGSTGNTKPSETIGTEAGFDGSKPSGDGYQATIFGAVDEHMTFTLDNIPTDGLYRVVFGAKAVMENAKVAVGKDGEAKGFTINTNNAAASVDTYAEESVKVEADIQLSAGTDTVQLICKGTGSNSGMEYRTDYIEIQLIGGPTRRIDAPDLNDTGRASEGSEIIFGTGTDNSSPYGNVNNQWVKNIKVGDVATFTLTANPGEYYFSWNFKGREKGSIVQTLIDGEPVGPTANTYTQVDTELYRKYLTANVGKITVGESGSVDIGFRYDEHPWDETGTGLGEMVPTIYFLTPVYDPDAEPQVRPTEIGRINNYIERASAVITSGHRIKTFTDQEGALSLFDNNLNSKTGINWNRGDKVVVSFSTLKPVVVRHYTMATANDSPERDPKTWALYGSSDGGKYELIHEVEGYVFPDERQVYIPDDFATENETAYSKYIFEISDFKTDGSDAYAQFSELVFSTGEPETPVQLEDGKILHYDFEEGTTDITGNYNGRATEKGVEIADGVARFFGNGVISFPTEALRQENLTISMTLNIRHKQTWQGILEAAIYKDDGKQGLMKLISQTGNEFNDAISMTVRDNVEGSYKEHRVSDSATKLPVDEWVQLTYVQEGSTGRMYLNDVMIAESTDMVFSTTQINPNSYAMIGGGKYWGDSLFTGSLSDFRLYNVALDDSAVAALSTENLAEVSETVEAVVIPAYAANPVVKKEDGSNQGYNNARPYCDHVYHGLTTLKKETFGLEPSTPYNTIELDIPTGAKTLSGWVGVCQDALAGYESDMSFDFLADGIEIDGASFGPVTKEAQKAEFSVDIPEGATKLTIKINNANQKWDHLTFFDTVFITGDDQDVIDASLKINAIDNELAVVPGYINNKIDAARVAYDALTEDQKAMITNYDDLVFAELAQQNFVDNFGLAVGGWKDEFKGYPWLNLENTTEEERQATRDALADEFRYQYLENNYLMSNRVSADVGNWMDIPSIGLEDKPNDNIADPWNGYRPWSTLTSPFAGMAFTEKGYHAVGFSYRAALGNSFVLDGKVWQVNWDGLNFHDDVPLVRGKRDVKVETWGYRPGSVHSTEENPVEDESNNTFRYAYALYSQTHKWDNKTLGKPEDNSKLAGDSGVRFQWFKGPQGGAFIAANDELIKTVDKNSNKPEGAYVIVDDIYAGLIGLADNDDARFAITGAPTANEYEADGFTVQIFENGMIVIDESGDAQFYSVEESAAFDVVLLINALPAVEDLTLADADAVAAARSALEDLTDTQKALVDADVIAILEAVEVKVQEFIDQVAADEVEAKINALPAVDDLKVTDGAAVAAARKAYNDLTDTQKELVNIDVVTILEAAEAKIKELMTAHITDVINIIDALPAVDELTLENEAAVVAAREAFNILSEADQVSVTNSDKLIAAEAKIVELKDQAAADAVKTLINDIPGPADIALTDKADVEAARAAYDALNAAAKAKVDNTLKLFAAETRIIQLTPDSDKYTVVYADSLEVQSDGNKFWTVPNQPTHDSEGAKHYNAYTQNGFSEFEHGLFQEPKDVEYSTLTIPVPTGATKFITLFGRDYGASTLAFKNGVDGDKNYGDNGKNKMEVYAGETKIGEAVHADGYAKLVECDIPKGTTQIVIRNYKGDNTWFDHMLFGNARFLIPVDEDIEDTIQLIDAIGVVTYKSGAKIKAARTAYDALDAGQKAAVTNVDVLTAAEAAFQEIADAFIVTITGWVSAPNSPWMNDTTDEEKDATRNAIADEIKYQFVEKGNNIGYDPSKTDVEPDGHNSGLICKQLELTPNDNVNNPWGHANRYWAYAQAPFVGVAFSASGYMSVKVDRIGILGNSFVDGDKVYQQFWDYYKVHDNVPVVQGSSQELTQVDMYPGSLDNFGIIEDATANNFRYAFAKYNFDNKLAGKTLGVPEEHAQKVGDTVYQKFVGPDGVAYIIGADFADDFQNAYVIDGELLETLLALDTENDIAKALEITGAPEGFVDGKFAFANGVIDGDEFVEHTAVTLANLAIAKIPALDKLTLDDEALVIDARDKFDEVPAADKNKVIGKDKLEAAEEKVIELKDDAAKAQVVIDLIDNLPAELTAENYDEFKAAVEEAEGEYDKLTAAQKTIVENQNYFVLQAARKALDEFLELGDVNGDGKLTVADIVRLRGYIMQDIELTADQLKVANVDEDSEGKTTVSDIVALRALIMGD